MDDAPRGEGAGPPSLSGRSVSLTEASRFWLRLGFVSFGGPAGQIALLHEELVNRRRWLSERRFLHALNYCMLLPGPEATQLASYLGWLMHGTAGGLIAGLLFLLPSIVILLALASAYVLWGHLPLLSSVFWALKPVVLAIVIQAAWRLARRTLRRPLLVGIAVVAFLALSWWRLPYPVLIVGAALTGWIVGRWRPGWLLQERSGGGAESETVAIEAGTVVIHGDDTPTPEHGRFRWRSLAVTLLISALALLLPLAWLTWQGGWNSSLATMARFFTRVALLSFGGAYAVLPYVAQGAVERFGWLDANQMIDGLALGETTPGPLIMVVAFVGFMGGWTASGSLLQALQAGLVVVWFTFLPSFVFILAGAPVVELSREDLRLGPPLTAISAALVGVIASLALLFAAPALMPGGRFDPGALVVGLSALGLLLGRGWGVLPLIGAAALVGALKLAIPLLGVFT